MKKLLKHVKNIVLQPSYRKKYWALQRLKTFPRYTRTSVSLSNMEVQLVDAASFLFQYKEIFQRQIYKFPAQTPTPRIIDCGANIGLSVIYFKGLYPESRITAFEPDPNIFAVLDLNVRQCGYLDVVLINKAVWTEETMLEFLPDGSDGGRMVQMHADRQRIQVPTVRLADFLNEPVDLLKIDIEGAETVVLQDCQDKLHVVRHVFVEYHSFADAPQTLHLLLTTLAAGGFRVIINPIRTIRQPFLKQKNFSGIDMQLNIFAWRDL
ncbi:methyltransferase FkbM family [Candidatus Moduliflexus flocculans]|uniref:Methyltransferase FkbM family n=1 Tax=Candidatus Moduliflexus flocculans TaxID=1499966 RepID=A0A0S6VUK3_9BACT|nr:methyltransferase FkbM family [Candidatus Moduliflexus flocculans]